MKVLFLDDEAEILNAYKNIERPEFYRREGTPTPSLFGAPSADDGFETVQQVHLRGAYFNRPSDALKEFTRVAGAPSRFRIAVLDMMMPEKSGVAVAKEMLLADPGLHIIFVTAYSDWSIRNIARDLGTSESRFMFLKKPFELQEVLQALIFMRDRILDSIWNEEAIRQLRLFASNQGAESLQLFETLTRLKTAELILSMGQERVDKAIQQNERIVNAVELLLRREFPPATTVLPVAEIISTFSDMNRVSVYDNDEPQQRSVLVHEPKLLFAAMHHLIQNALEYSEGPVQVRIRNEAGAAVEILIMDLGIGIEHKLLQDVFEPGFTLMGKGVHRGFGLAIAKKILLALPNSHLALRSEPGKGTRVRFRLALAP